MSVSWGLQPRAAALAAGTHWSIFNDEALGYVGDGLIVGAGFLARDECRSAAEVEGEDES